MDEILEQEVKDYVINNYKQKYKGKENRLEIEDGQTHFVVRVKDESPLILSKQIIKK